MRDYPEPSMDLATQTHLTTLRDLLNYRQTELRAEVHAAQPVSYTHLTLPTIYSV